MAKFTSEDVRLVAERLKIAHGRGHPAHLLIGAGCSITAGIPGAKDLVERIHADYAAHCAHLPNASKRLYGACMKLLSTNERRDLIRPYLDKAKINWGTIVLAQMIAKGLIDRVLTLNFDLVLERACALLGIQPAVYDFGVAPASDPAMIVSPSIVHLHGQSYGLVLLNTDDETTKHRDKLQPILLDTLRNAPLMVIGYSGSADGIFQTLTDEFQGREGLYWIGYDDEPEPHLHPLLQKEHARFIGGADFDRFMIELAQSLGCWPPTLFTDPLGHLIDELDPVVAYPVKDSDSEIDLLSNLRQRLEELRAKQLSGAKAQPDPMQFYMQGNYAEAAGRFAERIKQGTLADDERDVAAWSFVGWGNLLLEQALRTDGDAATSLFDQAAEKYQTALAIKPDKHEALNNLGNVALAQVRRASPDAAVRLCDEAAEKYRAALAIDPNKHEALDNWGAALSQKAKHATGDEAKRLFAEAEEKITSALKFRPGQTYNLACLRALQGRDQGCRVALEHGERRGTLPPAAHLMTDSDLDSVRDKAWFKELIARRSATDK